jgi:hypothetical protein
MIAYNYSTQLEESFLYANNTPEKPQFTGTYYSIVGNLPDDAVLFQTTLVDDGYELVILNSSDEVLEKILFTIAVDGETDPTIVTESQTNVVPGELDGYLFDLELEDSKSYTINVIVIENNTDTDEIDLAFFNLENHLYNSQDLWEGISTTTFIFALLAGFTVLGIFVTKKREV